jgi:hypothetical protein
MTDQGNENKILYNFIMKYLFNLYHQNNSCICITCRHYRSRRGTYKLVPESKSEQCEAQVNLIEVAEGPNQSSEEPKASFAQEGKPCSIISIFKLMQLLLTYGIVH